MDNVDRTQFHIEQERHANLLHHQHNTARLVSIANLLPKKRYCEDCGELIPDKRIDAVPHTTRCVRCQHAFEDDKH